MTPQKADPLTVNIDLLSEATRQTAAEMPADRAGAVRRFYHLLLLECCERMTVADFRRSIQVAREQLGRRV